MNEKVTPGERVDTIEVFYNLFVGNDMAVGHEDGGCTRYDYADQQLWFHLLYNHLYGTAPIGCYPHWIDAGGDTLTAWGCVDFDEGPHDSLVHAVNLHRYLLKQGVTSYIEKSRSKGYHVWVFANDGMQAWWMRNALLHACKAVGAPDKEVNPKQAHLEEGQVGNYVRLPYPRDHDDGRYMITYEIIHTPNEPPYVRTTPITLDEWIHGQIILNGRGKILELAGKYQPPPPPRIQTEHAVRRPDSDAHGRMSGLAYTIWKDGPLPDHDRSGTLYKLACQLREDGMHDFQEAVALVQEADQRWGKFHTRTDGPERIHQLVAKAWGG